MRIKTFAAVLIVLIFFSLVFYSVMFQMYSHPSPNSEKKSNGTMIGSGVCKIPNLHPQDPKVLPFMKYFIGPRCKQQLDFIQTNLDGTISFNETTFKKEKIDPETVRCLYQEIYKPNGTDNKVSIRKPKEFSMWTRVSTDVAHVKCNSLVGAETTLYENFLPIFHKKVNVASRVGREKPSILFIGSDSLSRLNAMRYLKESYEYLENGLKAHIFRLHVKSAFNTRPNMVALLTGKRMIQYSSAGEVFPAELNNTRNSFQDNWPFIWKDFAEMGYASAVGENKPSLTMFNYNMKGFRYQPVDHYLRNFFLAWKRLKDKGPKTKESGRNCVMSTPVYTTQYQWILNIMRMYKDNPVFCFALDAFTHDHISEFIPIDKPLKHLLESLHQEELLENTVMFVFGDHGIRYGSYRQTWMGRLEDYTPFFSIVLPQWMKNEYPHLERVLNYNEDKLTTWYDVHATLEAILQGDYGDLEEKEEPRTERGLSLFRKISSNRTCVDAGIPLQFCPCVREETIPVTDASVKISGRDLVEFINDKLKKHSNKCAFHKLKYIKEATAIRIKDTQKSLRNNRSKLSNISLKLVIETWPYGALFEAVMFFDHKRNKYSTNQDIERLDMYGSQGNCIQDSALERYCHCI